MIKFGVKMDLKSFQLHFTLNSAKYTIINGLIVWKISRILRRIHHFRHFEQERIFRAQPAVGLGVSCDTRESAPFSRLLRQARVLRTCCCRHFQGGFGLEYMIILFHFKYSVGLMRAFLRYQNSCTFLF